MFNEKFILNTKTLYFRTQFIQIKSILIMLANYYFLETIGWRQKILIILEYIFIISTQKKTSQTKSKEV